MRPTTLLATPVIALLFALGQNVAAQNPVDLGNPAVISLASNPTLAEFLIETGVITPVTDPSLPSGYGVSVNCLLAKVKRDEMFQMIDEARDDWLDARNNYDDLLLMQEHGWPVPPEDFDEALAEINQTYEYWNDLTNAFGPIIEAINALRNAADCPD